MAALNALQDYSSSNDSENDEEDSEMLTMHLKPVANKDKFSSQSVIQVRSNPAVIPKVQYRDA